MAPAAKNIDPIVLARRRDVRLQSCRGIVETAPGAPVRAGPWS